MKKFLNNNKFHVLYLIIIAIGAYICISPFIKYDLAQGHDLRFHFNRVIAFKNYFSTPVNFNTFDNRGKAVNLFYPSQIAVFIGTINSFVHSYVKSIKYFVLLITLISGVSSYWVMWKYAKSEHKAVIFSISYMTAQYYLSNIYIRFALGEFCAFAFLPIALLGIYYLLFDDSKKWYVFSIGLGLVLYNHLLSAILMIIITIVLFVISIINNREMWNKERFFNIIKSGIAFGILSLCVIVPIFEQQLSYEIYSTTQYFTFTKNLLSFGDFIQKSSDISIGKIITGPVVLCAFVANLVFWKRLNIFEKSLIVFSIILLILQTNIFPWKIFDESKFLFIQFLFRLNGLITLFVLFVFSNKIINSEENENVSKVIKTFSVTLLVVFSLLLVNKASTDELITNLSTSYHGHKYLKNSKRLNEEQWISYASSFVYEDYVNMKQVQNKKDFRLSNFRNHIKTFNEKQKKIVKKDFNKNILLSDKVLKVKPVYNETSYEVKVVKSSTNKESLVIPITLYKGIHIENNGKNVEPKLSKYGTLQISINNKVNNIKIWYTWTVLARISQVISLIGFISILVFAGINGFKKNKK